MKICLTGDSLSSVFKYRELIRRFNIFEEYFTLNSLAISPVILDEADRELYNQALEENKLFLSISLRKAKDPLCFVRGQYAELVFPVLDINELNYLHDEGYTSIYVRLSSISLHNCTIINKSVLGRANKVINLDEAEQMGN